MNAILNEDTTPLNHTVERLIAEHGFRAVSAAVMVRLMRRKAEGNHPVIRHLSNHLRRDMGLPEVEVEPMVLPIIPFTLPR